jgi:uncharacterized protein YndB with AHSA1/START domain
LKALIRAAVALEHVEASDRSPRPLSEETKERLGSTGTHLRMNQSGFWPDQQQAYQGAKGGWPQFFAALGQVLARID